MSIMNSRILRECVQHEIALLGIPEMYRAKLAFLAGFRFALEAAARDVIANRERWPEGHKLHVEAKATLDAIKLAGTEVHLDMRQAFGEPAAERFMRAMDRVGDFQNDLAAATKPRTEKQASPSEPDKQSESISVAGGRRPAVDPSAPKKAECGCYGCTLRRLFVAVVAPASSEKAAS